MKAALLSAFLFFTSSAFATSQYAWLEYGPTGPIARLILPGDVSCSNIVVDGVSHAMTKRAAATGDYNVTSCEYTLPQTGTTSASINGQALPVAKLNQTAKIAIIGDTGCRMKTGNPPDIQDCSDPNAWPFATNINSIAAWNPDLVIHVGDYYYREAKLQNGVYVKAGYNWSGWEADFFKPANPLLQNAPWIFTRGNHEMCGRAAGGWFRFLDPRTYSWEGQSQCTSNLDFTPPYWLTVGSMTFAVMDVSAADDTNVDASEVTTFRNQLQLIQNNVPSGTWLLLHMPFWVFEKSSKSDPDGLGTPTLYTAWSQANPQPTNIGLVVSGHKHLLETVDFSDGQAPQIVIGNGGTQLTGEPDKNASSIGGRPVDDKYVHDNFGFMAATPTTSGWTMKVMTEKGNLVTTCTAGTGSFDCGNN